MMRVGSWGRVAGEPHRVVPVHEPADLAAAMRSSSPGLPVGLRRSYGDACLNPGGTLWDLGGLDHFAEFDASSGRFTCEAGAVLRDIQRVVMGQGWSLPVLPGTQLVTLGGAIANDVHGKNHHLRGSFGDHVESLTLRRTDGTVIECGPQAREDWFEATLGGIGLTGVIERATVRLQRSPGPWLDTETLPFEGVREFCALADASESGWEHTVAWIDCLSPVARGLFLRAKSAGDQSGEPPQPRERSVPLTPPVSLMNRLSLRAFNAAYFHANRGRGAARRDMQSFLFPLDAIAHWNRMYGPRGFHQYQCVVPPPARIDALEALLAEIRRSGSGSFLAVLKTFGARASRGMMGFPMPGATLALDFPDEGERTEALFGRLDAIVQEAGGRLYLAKDARMPRSMFELGYPRREQFAAYRDPGISSAMSRRLFGS